MKSLRVKKLWLALGMAVGVTGVAAQPVHATPGLVDVYQMALLHDAELAQAQADFEASQQLSTQARSFLLPDIKAGVGVNRTESNQDNRVGTNQDMSLSLTQPIYNREALRRFDQTEIQMEQAFTQLRLKQQGLKLRVVEAYFQVLLAQQNLTLAEAKEHADKIEWEKAQASAEVGLASRTDVLQARSSYDLSISERISAANSLDIAYEELTRLTGQSLDAIKVLMLNRDLPEVDLDKAQLVQQAEMQNLDVILALQSMQVANAEIDVQEAGRWFDVSLRAEYLDRSRSDYKGIGANNGVRDTTVSMQLSVPLYQGGRTNSRITEARFKEQSAQLALRQAREQASLDARVQARNVERGVALINALREAVRSNEAFLEAAEEGYRVGLRNMLDVLTARSNVFQAQRNLAEAVHEFVINQIQLRNTIGQLDLEYLREVDSLLSVPHS